MANPFDVVRQFERAVAAYTGAPYVVSVTSCTDALMLAVAWHLQGKKHTLANVLTNFDIEIPTRTYVGVGHSILNAGGRPTFRDQAWFGYYELAPIRVYDSARWFSAGMYREIESQDQQIRQHRGGIGGMHNPFVCTSHHAQKTLGDTQGGCILHDDPKADAWLRRARFDGRAEGVAPKDDTFNQRAWHVYLSPDVAARLLWKLSVLPKHNNPLPWGPGTNSDYPDLSLHEAFQ